ncbi:MAG: hypothetical protein NUV63_11235, partial [Gallionella sp.]|nr:hypothetical protein [Gallionella sp.]
MQDFLLFLRAAPATHCLSSIKNHGEIMDALALDATRFVRPALRSIVLYFLVIVISSTTMMIKPAQAEGTVSAAVLYKGGTNNDGYDCT